VVRCGFTKRKEPILNLSEKTGLIILPEMMGKTVQLFNGREFVDIKIDEKKVGHYLGEFAITNQPVRHGRPGIGASRSSMYIPLK